MGGPTPITIRLANGCWLFVRSQPLSCQARARDVTTLCRVATRESVSKQSVERQQSRDSMMKQEGQRAGYSLRLFVVMPWAGNRLASSSGRDQGQHAGRRPGYATTKGQENVLQQTTYQAGILCRFGGKTSRDYGHVRTVESLSLSARLAHVQAMITGRGILAYEVVT